MDCKSDGRSQFCAATSGWCVAGNIRIKYEYETTRI